MMMLRVDHMVHRGDGILKALKAESRSVYLMEEHLQRLFIRRIASLSNHGMTWLCLRKLFGNVARC